MLLFHPLFLNRSRNGDVVLRTPFNPQRESIGNKTGSETKEDSHLEGDSKLLSGCQ